MNTTAIWIKATNYSQSYCCNCRLTPKTIFGRLPPYCPNCGAKMNNSNWTENQEGKLIGEDIFTPEQVKNMSEKEVKENYYKIIESIKCWQTE
jgi:hypothetical protein